MDSSQVKIFKQLGTSPAPATDTLIQTIDVVPPVGSWMKGCTLETGRHKVYAVGVDLAGNQSAAGTVYNIGRLPVPLYVADTTDWYIGELYNTYLGEIDVSV